MAISSFTQNILNRAGILKPESEESSNLVDVSIPKFEVKAPSMAIEMPKTEELLAPEAPKKIMNVALDIFLRAPARAAASITLGVLEELDPLHEAKVFVPITPAEKLLYGGRDSVLFSKQEIKSVQTRTKEVKKALSDFGIEGSWGDALSIIAVAGLTGLDMTPFGGSRKGLANALLKTKTAEEAAEILFKLGIKKDLIKIYAPKFAQITKLSEIERGIKSLENVMGKTTQVTKEATEQGARVASDLQPLAQEARYEIVKKYDGSKPVGTILNSKDMTLSPELYPEYFKKVETGIDSLFADPRNFSTAEEFVKAQGETLYRGGKGDGANFSNNRKVSEDFAKARGGEVNEFVLPHGSKIINYNDVPGIKYKGIDDFNLGRYAIPRGESRLDFMNGMLEKDYSVAEKWAKKNGYDAIKFPTEGETRMINADVIKTKSQLEQIYKEAIKSTKGLQKETLPIAPKQTPPISLPSKVPVPSPIISDELAGKTPISPKVSLEPSIAKAGEEVKLPAVIQGETFTLGASETIQPTAKELRIKLREEIKATKLEIKNAKIATEKAAKLEAKEQKIRTEAIENINRFRGKTDNIIESLKSRHLSDEDIANVILEDGTKLTDAAKIKRNADGSLAAVIKKSELEKLKANYTDELPKEKWEKRSILVEGLEVPIKMARSIELPSVWFERKGLGAIYDPVIQAGRDAEVMKNGFIQKFKDAGLFKEGGWFTADKFNLSKSEAEHVGQYYLSRQGRGYKVALTDLSKNEQKFVEVFDGIIAETEPRFFETAKLNGKTPGKVTNYAPIMTNKDFKLIDQAGSMDWLFRNHPAFSSLKERAKQVPKEIYELDYREVAARWLDGITDFLNYGETTPKLKYLINSDEFKGIVKEGDWQFISNWLKDVTTKEMPTSAGGQSLNALSRLLRKGAAVSALGLNYASVLKQSLTQIPIMIIEKVVPKAKSQYAKAFGIDVTTLPSITKRRGDIAIQDLQGRIGRIFTGALTQFDKKNAQLSLNGLLDKEYGKFLKEGAEITPEVQKLIEKRAQDKLDMWYGGFFKGQRPEAFRKELGNFILMFTYPLTSQLNGFYRHILTAKGATKIKAGAEVLAAATAIAYIEQVIENLSPQWSDEKGMTKDILLSLAGNIPLVGDIIYSIVNEKEMQISPALGNINNVIRKITKGEGVGWAIAETFGTPKQIRRIKEGLEIMEQGGITDDEGKMLAPVQDTMELIRSFLRGKYGSIAAQDWIRNIGEKSENRRWFVPEVEFLQNGDYERKAELYKKFDKETKKELYNFLSEGQQKKLDSERGVEGTKLGGQSVKDFLTTSLKGQSVKDFLKVK